MTQFTVERFDPAEHARWDQLIAESVNGTLFHRLGFLAYHGDRFASAARHLVITKNGRVWGQLSLALRERDGNGGGKDAVSPYGGSYGGIVLQRPSTYRDGKAAVTALLEWLRATSVASLRLTFPPACCARQPLDTLYFNLLETGFLLKNRDITSVFQFGGPGSVDGAVSQRARRMARKAERDGVTYVEPATTDEFWPLLQATFHRHGTAPTHDREQLEWLMARFPERIYLSVARRGGEPLAGICHFIHNARVAGAFYICQTPAGQEAQALSGLVLSCLRRRAEEGFDYYDFGTSSVNMVARENVFEFKENFTRIGFFRDTYEWSA